MKPKWVCKSCGNPDYCYYTDESCYVCGNNVGLTLVYPEKKSDMEDFDNPRVTIEYINNLHRED